MAKLECILAVGFDDALERIEDGVLNGSVSATLEDSSNFRTANARCAVRVFERYSWSGGNRLSLSVTLFQADGGPGPAQRHHRRRQSGGVPEVQHPWRGGLPQSAPGGAGRVKAGTWFTPFRT